jgi:hypothetical protein
VHGKHGLAQVAENYASLCFIEVLQTCGRHVDNIRCHVSRDDNAGHTVTAAGILGKGLRWKDTAGDLVQLEAMPKKVHYESLMSGPHPMSKNPTVVDLDWKTMGLHYEQMFCSHPLRT